MTIQFFRDTINFFFPRICSVCGKDIPSKGPHSLCGGCFSGFSRWRGLSCRVCGEPLLDGGTKCAECFKRRRDFVYCRSAGLFEGVLKTGLVKLKYGGEDFLARPLGEIMAKTWKSFPELKTFDHATPVPLHYWRERHRGFNQSRLLAKAFALRAGLTLTEGLLRRRKPTPSQTRLKRAERFENVSDAFEIGRKGAEGKFILLVDDVCTTGATLEACARVLKKAGARDVAAFTLARQPL